jgi:hypothetical protein
MKKAKKQQPEIPSPAQLKSVAAAMRAIDGGSCWRITVGDISLATVNKQTGQLEVLLK